MKKTLKRIVCFLLAFVVMVSIPLDIQAHAVATETWMVYALITYLAGMGITFTVSGGVNAMIQAMEEKVKDYEQANNIVDFYEYVRNRNVRLVPNNNQDPDGNRFFDLFFTGAAVEAIQAFANWLTSEGGWGGENSYNLQYGYTLAELVNEGVSDNIVVTLTSIGDKDSDGFANVLNLGDVYSVASVNQMRNDDIKLNGIYFSRDSNFWSFYINMSNSSKMPSVDFYRNFAHWSAFRTYDFESDWGSKHFTVDDIEGIVFERFNDYSVCMGFLMSDSSVYILNEPLSTDVISLSSSVDIMTPEELQEQFPSVEQGVSIKDAISVPMGDPTLAEWAQRMEETFGLTGTIPKPVPEVVADPDVVPEPSPVPTPPVYEDVDGLGLPSLAETMKNKFPFCLPYDLGRVFQIFYAEPVAPYWEVDLFATLGNRVPFVGDTAFTIDLAEYEDLGRISRWMTTIGYTLLLILITRQTTKW